MSHWFGNSSLKESDTIYFFERKHIIEGMEPELTEASERTQKLKIWR